MSGKEDTITIKVETSADNGGLNKAQQAVKGIARSAQAAGDESVKAASKSQNAFTKFGQCLDDGTKKLQKLVTGFGSFSIVQQAFNNYRAAIQHVNETLAKQKDYLASTLSGNTAAAVKSLAKEYDSLKESIAAVNEEMAHADKLADMRLANIRKQQDAETDLAEEREIGALAADDPDRQLKETAIRDRYSARRGEVAGKRGGEDIETRAARLEAEAAALEKAVQEASGMLPEIAQQRSESQQRAGRKLEEAAKYKDSWWQPNVKKGERWAARAQGDLENVTALNEQEMAIMRDNEARAAKAARLREEAAATRESKDPAAAESAVQGTRAARAVSASGAAVTQSAAARAEDERRLASDSALLEQRRAEKDALERRRREAQYAADREADEAARAASAAEGARMTYGDRPRSRAGRETVSRLDEAAAREAEEANAAARRAAAVMNQTAAALKALDQGISQLERSVNTLSRKNNTAQADILAGD